MKTMVRPLGEATKDDFFRMREHESCNWCFCVVWHVPTWDGWTDRTAKENQTLRERLLQEGKYDGYFLYADDNPIGWCQCAPLEWFPKLAKQMGLESEPKNTFVVGCIEILPEYRKKGLSKKLLDGVLADLKRRGVNRVIAIPREGKHEDGKVWTGPVSLFESCGFGKVGQVGDRSVVAWTSTQSVSSGIVKT